MSMIKLTVNGVARSASAEPRMSLLDFLRENLGLNATHMGCEHGVCGACTIIVNGEPARSCLMLAVQADGATVETVEGLAHADGALNPLQLSFRRHHALQCGFCTSGILMSMTWLQRRGEAGDREKVIDTLSGHLCRCTGYQPIVDAVLDSTEEG